MNVRTFGLAFALALVVLIALGQSVTNSTPLTRFEYLPHPRDMVKLQDGVPYVVPAEKILVLTGLGSASINGGSCTLFINGTAEQAADAGSGFGGPPSVKPLAAGLKATPGSTVLVSGNPGRAWGYLAPLSAAPSGTLRIPYQPKAQDLVQITMGTPLTVPPEHVFVVTGVGDSGQGQGGGQVLIDGIAWAAADTFLATYGESSVRALPIGLTAQPGSIVSTGGGQNSRVWGYLAVK